MHQLFLYNLTVKPSLSISMQIYLSKVMLSAAPVQNFVIHHLLIPTVFSSPNSAWESTGTSNSPTSLEWKSNWGAPSEENRNSNSSKRCGFCVGYSSMSSPSRLHCWGDTLLSVIWKAYCILQTLPRNRFPLGRLFPGIIWKTHLFSNIHQQESLPLTSVTHHEHCTHHYKLCSVAEYHYNIFTVNY